MPDSDKPWGEIMDEMDHEAKYQSATIDDPKYLIWSNVHSAWWGADSGYATGLNDARQFSRALAIRICREALPSSIHEGFMTEIPVRLSDIAEILHQQTVPDAALGAKPEWPTNG